MRAQILTMDSIELLMKINLSCSEIGSKNVVGYNETVTKGKRMKLN